MKLNYYRKKHGLSHGTAGIAPLAAFLFEKDVPKNYAICRWHELSNAIFNQNFGRTQKLNLNHYRLKHGLSHGISIARLAAILFEKKVPNLCAICRWQPLSDAISDENFGRTKKLSLKFYRLKHRLSHCIWWYSDIYSKELSYTTFNTSFHAHTCRCVHPRLDTSMYV